ncbi:MAG: hypothetical protein KatS3mg082_0167 [Nitrospiraceae bacterium]|nr:MAG: hypothetical protein KatS3mg082_0167 [Nitrospiraceae bacterium]
MRVLHCPTDTGGHAWGLSRAERKHGIESDVMVRRSSRQWFPADINLRLREGSLASQLVRVMGFVARAIRRYDVFHFNWGMSILDHRSWNINYLELPLLKRLGKRIVITFQGCDARMKTESRRRFSTSACAECDVAWCTERLDRIRQRRARKVFRYADQIFALNPDLLHFLPGGEFLPYASVNPAEWKPDGGLCTRRSSSLIRILHMPTNRSIKGTRYVERACAELTARGFPVELMVVEEVPHIRVEELIRQSDLVVDQLLIGWYGAFAVEAMALKKPVLCYLREEDLKEFVQFQDRIPIVRTTKETLADDIARLLKDRASWEKIGSMGRRFVEDCHDPVRIAQRTISAYQGGGS